MVSCIEAEYSRILTNPTTNEERNTIMYNSDLKFPMASFLKYSSLSKILTFARFPHVISAKILTTLVKERRSP